MFISEKENIEVFFGGLNVRRGNLSFNPGVNSMAPVFIGRLAYLSAEAAYKGARKRCPGTSGASIARDDTHTEEQGYVFNEDGSPKPLVFSYLVPVSVLQSVGVDIEAAKAAGKFAMKGKIRVAIRDKGSLNSLSCE